MAVDNSFKEFPSSKINDSFLTLQNVMESVLENYGGNNFKIKHGRKRNIQNTDFYNYNLTCNRDTYESAKQYLTS